MPATTTEDARDDLLTVIGGQHATVRTLFANTHSAGPDARGAAFAELTRFIAVHEAAEQAGLHVADTAASDAEMAPATPPSSLAAISAQRVREEESAAAVIENLMTLDAASGTFLLQLGLLEEAVSAHARAEETEEIPAFLAKASTEDIARAVSTLRRVDKLTARDEGGDVLPPGQSFEDQVAAARRALGGHSDRLH